MPDFDYDAAFANTPKNGEAGVGPVLLTATCVITGGAGATLGVVPTNTVRIGKAGTKGALLSKLVFTPMGNVSLAGVAYLFSSMDGGTTKRLIAAQPIAQQSPGVGTPPTPTVFPYGADSSAERLEAGEELYAGSSVAAASPGIMVSARLSDLLAV